jgi:hypothetical protein
VAIPRETRLVVQADTVRHRSCGCSTPRKDYTRLSFVRVGEQYRTPFFHIAPGENDDEAALQLALPDLGKDTPERYAAALYIGDTIAALKPELTDAKSLAIRLRAVEGQRKTVQVTLVETDGAAWTTSVVADGGWATHTIPLESLVSSRSILIPTPYPGLWNYWREIPAHRGGPATTSVQSKSNDYNSLSRRIPPATPATMPKKSRGIHLPLFPLTPQVSQACSIGPCT